MFPWVFWTIGFAAWNIIGALIWLAGGFYNTESIYGISVAVSRNYGGAFAFFFIPTLLVGGLIAYDVYKPGNKFTARFSGASQPQQMAAVPAQAQARAQASVFCRSCGAANTPGDAFCANCGASMTTVSAPASAPRPQAPATAAGTKVCANCGTSNPASNVFCKRCGNRLS
jgi:ribosomal protein L40E